MILDAEDIFAETDSSDTAASRPIRRTRMRLFPGWPVEISDDEMESVCSKEILHLNKVSRKYIISGDK